VRAGVHCSPLAHRTQGTLETGTVRLSFSAFNTPKEVDRFAELLETMIRKGV
jgi:selenocysteine lyase/cysteine desulfurase